MEKRETTAVNGWGETVALIECSDVDETYYTYLDGTIAPARWHNDTLVIDEDAHSDAQEMAIMPIPEAEEEDDYGS